GSVAIRSCQTNLVIMPTRDGRAGDRSRRFLLVGFAPTFEALRDGIARAERGELVAELLARAVDAVDRGARRDAENLRDLVHREIVPVVQLERDLRVEREPRQRALQLRLLLAARELRGRAGADVGEARVLRIELHGAELRAKRVVQLVARDREQQRRRIADRVAARGLEALEERPLHEIDDVVARLAREES